MQPRLTWHIYGRGSLLEATLNGETYSERFNDHTAKTDRERLRIEKNFRRRAEEHFHSLRYRHLPEWLRPHLHPKTTVVLRDLAPLKKDKP